MVLLVDRQPVDQRRRVYLLASHPAGELRRKLPSLYGHGAQRVVAGDPVFLAVVEDPDRGDSLLHLLSGALAKVPVQRFLTGGKGRAKWEMLLTERLPEVALLQWLATRGCAELVSQRPQVLVWLRRIDQRLYEDTAPLRRQLDHLVGANRFPRRSESRAADKVGRVTSGKRSRPINKVLLVRRDAKIEAAAPGCSCHVAIYVLDCAFSIVRYRAVQVNRESAGAVQRPTEWADLRHERRPAPRGSAVQIAVASRGPLSLEWSSGVGA